MNENLRRMENEQRIIQISKSFPNDDIVSDHVLNGVFGCRYANPIQPASLLKAICHCLQQSMGVMDSCCLIQHCLHVFFFIPFFCRKYSRQVDSSTLVSLNWVMMQLTSETIISNLVTCWNYNILHVSSSCVHTHLLFGTCLQFLSQKLYGCSQPTCNPCRASAKQCPTHIWYFGTCIFIAAHHPYLTLCCLIRSIYSIWIIRLENRS